MQKLPIDAPRGGPWQVQHDLHAWDATVARVGADWQEMQVGYPARGKFPPFQLGRAGNSGFLVSQPEKSVTHVSGKPGMAEISPVRAAQTARRLSAAANSSGRDAQTE
jgi:hypothetical protein